MINRSSRSLARAGVAAALGLVLAAACAAPATITPTATPDLGTPTAEPTETPLALTSNEVPGLVKNKVTFAGVEYALKDAFVSNQDPRTYAEGGSPEPTETSYAYLVMSGNNTTKHRPDLAVGIFSLLLADSTAIEATDLFGRGTDFIAPPARAAADGFLVFQVDPAVSLTGASLRIGKAPDRPALLLLTAQQPAPVYPIQLAAGGEARGIGVTNGSHLLYTLLGGGLYIDNPLEAPNYDTGPRANENELFLVLDIRILMESGSLEGTFADQFRLIVNGAPRAPWNSPTGGSIGVGAAVDTKVGWLIPADVTDVILQVGDPAHDPGTIAIALPAP
jgi:hypothetical protein